MTLIKSLLLGSAATLVVVAGAQAADLPTKKGAPAAEYVKVCKIDGMAGFVIPGSDTCLKISGYLTGQVEAGNLSDGYAWGVPVPLTPAQTAAANAIANVTLLPTTAAGVTAAANAVTQAKFNAANQLTLQPGVAAALRPDIGYTTRWNLAFDTKNNTAYGVLTAHADMQFEYGSGFDNTGAGSGYVNHAYLNWAGITAGKANSFFSAFGGGEGWANLFSPDQQGYNQPLLLAYTATFGGGFSATISLQDPILGGASGPGVDEVILGNSAYEGLRSPDIVGAIDLTQGWGTAHAAVVAHNVNVVDDSINANTQNTWGWALDAGVKFNLPTLGAGDEIQFQGSWSQNAIWYSGLPGAMWDEGLGNAGGTGVNGNGQATPYADTFSNGNGTWATPTAWSIAASAEFHFSPVFFIAPEIGYGELHWSGLNAGQLAANSDSWMGGAVFHWDPVAHLDFNLELLYQSTNQSRPTGYTAALQAVQPWVANTSGLEGRFEITRDF